MPIGGGGRLAFIPGGGIIIMPDNIPNGTPTSQPAAKLTDNIKMKMFGTYHLT